MYASPVSATIESGTACPALISASASCNGTNVMFFPKSTKVNTSPYYGADESGYVIQRNFKTKLTVL